MEKKERWAYQEQQGRWGDQVRWALQDLKELWEPQEKEVEQGKRVIKDKQDPWEKLEAEVPLDALGTVALRVPEELEVLWVH